jgi:hypothetical protein
MAAPVITDRRVGLDGDVLPPRPDQSGVTDTRRTQQEPIDRDDDEEPPEGFNPADIDEIVRSVSRARGAAHSSEPLWFLWTVVADAAIGEATPHVRPDGELASSDIETIVKQWLLAHEPTTKALASLIAVMSIGPKTKLRCLLARGFRRTGVIQCILGVDVGGGREHVKFYHNSSNSADAIDLILALCWQGLSLDQCEALISASLDFAQPLLTEMKWAVDGMRARVDELPGNVRPLLNGFRDGDWISWRLLDIGEEGKALIVNWADGSTTARTLCAPVAVDPSHWAIPTPRDDLCFLDFSVEKTGIYVDGGRINLSPKRHIYMLLIMAHPWTLTAVVAILTLAAQALQDIAVTPTQNLRLAALSIGIVAVVMAVLMELAFIDNKFSANIFNRWAPRSDLVAGVLYPGGRRHFKRDLFVISRSTHVAVHGENSCPYLLQSGPGMLCSTGLSIRDGLAAGVEVYLVGGVPRAGGEWDIGVLFAPPEQDGPVNFETSDVPLYQISRVARNPQLWHLVRDRSFIPAPTRKLVPCLGSEAVLGGSGAALGYDAVELHDMV